MKKKVIKKAENIFFYCPLNKNENLFCVSKLKWPKESTAAAATLVQMENEGE